MTQSPGSLFIWEDYSENIHTKKPKSVPIFQGLPSQKSACGGLKPLPRLMPAQQRRSVSVHKQGKGVFVCAEYLYVQSTVVVADIQRWRFLSHNPLVWREAVWALCCVLVKELRWLLVSGTSCRFQSLTRQRWPKVADSHDFWSRGANTIYI